ncbi:MAG: hypothetical protein DRN14_04170 [Thermoplasmata archaeon]|nr:MAG: hypothetical protein DRN14_04170 [Thermoplasmata archaeon]
MQLFDGHFSLKHGDKSLDVKVTCTQEQGICKLELGFYNSGEPNVIVQFLGKDLDDISNRIRLLRDILTTYKDKLNLH